jgi:hypothetical protein
MIYPLATLNAVRFLISLRAPGKSANIHQSIIKAIRDALHTNGVSQQLSKAKLSLYIQTSTEISAVIAAQAPRPSVRVT